ncbi:MAG: hypothetical protein CMK46_08735 [Porticoccus sp.]|jgi:SutA-like transcriptional regulator|nr:hypothetical protein [Porticoccus sp.]
MSASICNKARSVNKLPTKSQLRRQLQQQVDSYLKQGGEIQQIPRGISGRENACESLPTVFFNQPKAERTPVPEVLAALDSRRPKKPSPNRTTRDRPKETIIYDDFGEPIRRIWQDK